MIKHLIAFLSALLMLIFFSCAGDSSNKVKGDGWTVKGHIAGGADSTLYIETATMNNWYAIDSLRLGQDENFAYTAAAPDTLGGIYRLRFGQQYIYFPATGNGTVELSAQAKNFATGYKLDGTEAARNFALVDRMLNSSIDSIGVEGTIANRNLRNRLNKIITEDTTCVVAYYVINKRIGPDFIPFYNVLDPTDIKFLGAVATKFKTMRPNDPRTADLEAGFIAAKKEVNKRLGRGKVMEVSPDAVVGHPQVDLSLYDAAGKAYNVEKILSSGRPVVLNFVCLTHKDSPANTMALNKIRSQFGDRVTICQISFDPDELAWRSQAAKLPWISLWATPSDRDRLSAAYNVNPYAAPVSFILDAAGQIVSDRIADPAKLPETVARFVQ